MLYSNCKELKVLFVDDEQGMAKSIKIAIGEYFDKFMVVSNGVEALKVYKKEHPDLLITDIMMPQMDGLTLAKKIREDSPFFPIIIQSAYSDREKLLEAIDIGVNKYFIKPFCPDELLSYIESLVYKIRAAQTIDLTEGFTFNKKNRRLYLDQKMINLTKREIIFMELLVAKRDRMVDNLTMKKKLWKDYKQVSNERIRTFIKRLRQKTSKGLIINSLGEGYMPVYL